MPKYDRLEIRKFKKSGIMPLFYQKYDIAPHRAWIIDIGICSTKQKKTPPKLYFLQDLLPTKLQLFELPSHDSVCSFGFHTTSLPVTCIRSEFHKRVAIPILIKDGVKFPDSSHNLARFWFVLARNVIGIVQGKVKCGHFKIKVTFLRGCVKRKW